jgi:GTP-binding protein
MRAQTEAALAGADAVLFLIDARAGLLPADRAFADLVRRAGKPAILVANKSEGRAGDAGAYEAYGLGLGEPVALSAEHGEGLADLYAALRAALPDQTAAAETGEPPRVPATERPIRVAVVGRPNVGKSTLINRLLGEERLLTGPEAGTTRDAIAVDLAWEGRSFQIYDTAGMRRRARIEDKLEKLSVADARRAVDFAEVVVLLLDATLGLEAQDLRIADNVLQEGRALIIAINKWDVAEHASSLFQGIRGALDEGLSQARGLPLLAVSGKTGKGIDQLLAAAFEIREIWSKRVSTGQLNRWFEDAIEKNPPPAPGGKRIKLRYITQVNTRPPSFVVFGNRLEDVPGSYERYLINGIRKELGFGAVPIRLALRAGKNPYKQD